MLTTAEVAARLGVTPEAVRKAIKRSRLVAAKHGRDYLISVEAVAAYTATKSKGGRPKKERG